MLPRLARPFGLASAALVLFLVACGSSASSSSSGGGGDGGVCRPECKSDGTIGSRCCDTSQGTGACPGIAPFCDLGGGTCRLGSCVKAGEETAPVSCGTKTCSGSDVCVETENSGGPAGSQPSTDYTCAKMPAACSDGFALACATPLCDCESGGGALEATIDATKSRTLHCACARP